ncbi:protein NO VEIN domain-containing protein [Pontibacter toksunensis]|uniref:Protein NO VEIN domain-containing protein n=1 Tax=Pontibacter toksunensis TaxID=1332631 RepID=A0ABW6C386_9BACT
MKRKIAIKRLTISDLGLFKAHFDSNKQPDGTQKGGKQKSINLNSDVFIKRLYPNIPENKRDMKVKLSIYGPGLANTPHIVNRSIRKSSASKNWRLNGEFVRDPEISDGYIDRYHNLQEGDLALFEFFGNDEPDKVKLVLISQGNIEDKNLYPVLNNYLGTSKMVSIDEAQVSDLMNLITDLKDEHPAQSILLNTDELELAALGGAIAFSVPVTERSVNFEAVTRPSLRSISPELFHKAKEKAEQNGEDGEEIINSYLEALHPGEFEWSSKSNAVSPYDFRLTDHSKTLFIEVKSTSSNFANKFHISINELKQAIWAKGEYHIYRVYNITEEGAKLRKSGNIKEFATEVLKQLVQLPQGVVADGITVDPVVLADKFSFGEEIDIELEDDIS